MADESLQLTLAIPKTTEKPIGFPLEMIFTYDGTAKSQDVYKRQVQGNSQRLYICSVGNVTAVFGGNT